MTRAKEFAECVRLDSSCPSPIAFLCHRADVQHTSQTFLPVGDKPWSPLRSGAVHVLFPIWCEIWLFCPSGYGQLVGFWFLFFFYYWRCFDKLGFRLGYPAGSRDLWGNPWAWLRHWGMEQKTGLWQRKWRVLRHTIPQKVQRSSPPPQVAMGHGRCKPGRRKAMLKNVPLHISLGFPSLADLC